MTDRANLLTREDTLLGVCAGLADELGIDVLLPRLLFALALFWNPVAVAIAYVTLGVALALFRWAFPPHRADHRGRSDTMLV